LLSRCKKSGKKNSRCGLAPGVRSQTGEMLFEVGYQEVEKTLAEQSAAQNYIAEYSGRCKRDC